MSSDKVGNKKSAKINTNFGAPPKDLGDQRTSITDFFTAAKFQPVLTEDFLQNYAGKQPNWGPIGYVTYKRTYARPLYPEDLGIQTHASIASWIDKDGNPQEDVIQIRDPNLAVRSEEYWESLTRILNGLWHIIRCHSARKNIEFSETTARRKAENMFKRMWEFKWLPPGRGLWMMGTRFMYLKGSASLNNCGYVSTVNIAKECSEPFAWAMDMSMLGVGVGFDTTGAKKIEVKRPSNIGLIDQEDSGLTIKERVYSTQYDLPVPHEEESIEEYTNRAAKEMSWAQPKNTEYADYLLEFSLTSPKLFIKKIFWSVDPFSPKNKKHIIPDSREGWVESVSLLIDAFLKGTELPSFDYSQIRPAGSPIRGFGGTAEGPKFLEWCHENLVTFFLERIGTKLTAADITDIFNEIGACVVSGNVRRSAQIALGDPNDEDFISLKHDFINHPNCWNSNNSVLATLGMDYNRIAELITTKGEPGFLWLDNSRKYGRMGDPANNKDKNAMGTNPCGEQTLHNYELCCLVENFISLHEDEQDFFTTLKQSYLYAKAVTLVPSHSKKTNKVMGQNSRIGCSLSGIQQARVKFGTHRLLRMCDSGYRFIRERDETYSDWLQVRNSIKVTSIKPSGTVSLLPGVTPGIHYATEQTYLRHIRFAKSNKMVPILKEAGYRVFDAPEQPESTVCIAFPVKEKYIHKTEAEAASNIWEQLEFVAQLQHVWADNQVSVTVKFHQTPESTKDIATALELYETRLKSVSFLPYFSVNSATAAGYAALPYQAITDEQYEEEIKNLGSYSFEEAVDDLLVDVNCDTGVCPVR